MKKWIALLLAAVMCLSLAACGNGKTEDNTDNSQEQNMENTSNDSEQGNGNAEQLTDERYQEGTDPADIDEKFVGVWYGYDESLSGVKLEFFADGRIIVNDDTEYRWKEYDGKHVNVYLKDEYCGACYLCRDGFNEKIFNSLSEIVQNGLFMELPYAEELMGNYTRENYHAE